MNYIHYSCRVIILCAVASLIACSGGGNSNNPGPTPTPNPTSTPVPTPTPTPAPTALQISSLSATSIAPFAQLTVTGSGFDPSASAAISVVLMSVAGNPPVVVPAVAPSSTTIQITVPPLFSTAGGTFAGDTVDVQVIQMSGNTLFTSNVIPGLEVGALPAIPTGVAIGAITLGFLEGSLNVSASLQADAATNSSLAALAASLTPYNAHINDVITDVKFIMSNPERNVAVTTSNGVAAVLMTQNTLALSDQMILAYVTQFSNLTNQASPTQGGRQTKPASEQNMPAPATTPCPMITGDASTDNMECLIQQSAQAQAVVGGKAVQVAANFLYSSYLGILGGFGAQALAGLGTAQSSVLSFQVIWGAASSYVAAFGTASPAPTPCNLVAGAAATVIDNVALHGVGIVSATRDAANLYSNASKILTPSPVSPCTGPLLTGPQANAPPGTTVVNGFQTAKGVTTTATLAAPIVQRTEPTSVATIPPPETFTLTVAVASGDGSVESFPAGILCGSCASDTASFPVNARVALTATPTTGQSLSQWSGACSGIGPCVVKMTSNQTVTAKFSPGQTFSGTFVAPFNGIFPDPAGDTYSASASSTIVLNVVQNSNGTISGSASVPTFLGVAVASCPIGGCTTSSGSENAVGSMSGTASSFGGTFLSPDQNFMITFSGSLSGSSVTGSATFSAVFFGTSGGTTIHTTLSGSASGITLAAQ